MIHRFPNIRQMDQRDCGPACLKSIAKYYGKEVNLARLRTYCETTARGTNLFTLSEGAEKIGFKTIGLQIDFDTLSTENILPCIAHWMSKHYVVVYKITKKKVFVSDPAIGLMSYSHEEFREGWLGKRSQEVGNRGVVLFLDTTPSFYRDGDEEADKRNASLFIRYLFQYKKFLFQLFVGLLCGSLISLFIPFLNQAVIDNGIQNRNLNLIYLILVAQIMLTIGTTTIGMIRSWILIHMNTRINISLISDFFIKLMNLPISYFDTRKAGDILQRIADNKRIETLLSSTTLSVLFSLLNFIVYSFVLAYYSTKILGIFLIGSFLHSIWIFMFLKARKRLDYKRFSIVSEENNKMLEIINGIQEIKLFNSERRKRWDWEYIQSRLFKLGIKRLSLSQKQDIGSTLINNIKNILVTIISAQMVISGEITFGMMVAISYILGQLNAPISQFLSLINIIQDAKISLDRLNEVYSIENEDNNSSELYTVVPPNADITLKDVSFRYAGMSAPVFENLNLCIPANKVTAIVGRSGGGKTTLMKLLLKIYEPSHGTIYVGKTDLKRFQPKAWRDNLGIVMQEGYLFNSTIAENIAVGQDEIDMQALNRATEIANLQQFIDNLPLGYNTEVGFEGMNISTGQKQRVLIARAVYRNPRLLIFDEATSSLDSSNEYQIMNNLSEFFKNRTVIIIAHRLSTVRNADQIVVLDNNGIAEIGDHVSLVKKQGIYFSLVRNQLDLSLYEK